MDVPIPWWGLTLNHTLFLLAVVLICVDFFVSTDVPTHVAYIIFRASNRMSIQPSIVTPAQAGVHKGQGVSGFPPARE